MGVVRGSRTKHVRDTTSMTGNDKMPTSPARAHHDFALGNTRPGRGTSLPRLPPPVIHNLGAELILDPDNLLLARSPLTGKQTTSQNSTVPSHTWTLPCVVLL